MEIKTLQHTDVRGKVLFYLQIRNRKGSELLLNVGEKTVNRVDELNKEDEIINKIQVLPDLTENQNTESTSPKTKK